MPCNGQSIFRRRVQRHTGCARGSISTPVRPAEKTAEKPTKPETTVATGRDAGAEAKSNARGLRSRHTSFALHVALDHHCYPAIAFAGLVLRTRLGAVHGIGGSDRAGTGFQTSSRSSVFS